MSTEQTEFKPAVPDNVVQGNKSFVSVDEDLTPEEPKQVATPPAPVAEEVPPPPPPPTTTPPAAAVAKPEGWDIVDFNKIQDPELRSQVEARFNRLYGQVKTAERQWETVRQYQERLEQQLEELKAGQSQVLQNEEEKAINELKTRFVDEYNKGNHDEVIKILGQLNEKDLERRMKEQKVAAPAPATEAQPIQIPEAAKLEMQRWALDKPYAQRGSPLFQHTINAMNHYLKEGAKLGKDLPWLLATTEQYMNGVMEKMNGSPANKASEAPKIVGQVLGQQQGVVNNKSSSPSLTEEEKVIARKLFNRLPPNEAYAKYSKGKKL